MALINRTYTFTDGTVAYGSQVDSEIANIVNTINNLDSATTKWDQVSILNSSSIPLIVDNSTGSQDIANFKVNGVTKTRITPTGEITITGTGLGIILTDNDGTGRTWRILVNAGVLSVQEVT